MGELLTIGGVALTIIALIAAGIAAVQLANVKALRETNGDLRDRVGDLESAWDRSKSDLANEKEQHAATRRDLAAVAKVVTGEAHWVALEQQLTAHHDETAAILQQIIDTLRARGV